MDNVLIGNMSDEEFFKIMDGMEEVNREMVAK